LFALLTANPAVTALLGSKIFGLNTPEVGEPLDGLPAVAYFRVSSARYFSMDNVDGSSTVLARSRFQFDCKAEDYDTARQVARTIAAAMRGFHGNVAGVSIDSIFEVDDRDIYDAATKICVRQKDFQVFHLE
jgi:hypothetical protein